MKNSRFLILLLIILFSASCKKEIAYFDSPADNNLELPLLLSFNNKPCLLDIDTKTFKFPISQDVVVDFSPFIEFQDYSNIKFDNKKLLNNDINCLGKVEINKPYDVEITANDETSKFTFYFTPLPVIQIITLDNIKIEPKVFGRIILNYPEEDKNSVSSLIGIEYRGASSRKYKKKSYGFKLINGFDMDRSVSEAFFDMKSANSWILDGMYVDKAKLRNKTGFEIWTNLTGETDHIGIKSEYVEVFYNSTYQGIYCFHENITGELLSLNNESELIVGKENTKATKFVEFPHGASQGAMWNHWEQKFPDPDTQLNWTNFEALCKLVTEGSDTEFSNNIFNKIEKDNLIDYYLFISLFCGYDNVGKNWFFMQKKANDKFIIIPWDLDSSWGRSHEAEEVDYDKKIKSGLFKRLIEVNPQNFNQELKNRWQSLRENEFSEASIYSNFDYNFDILNHSNVIDFENERWKEGLNLDEEENYIKEWIPKRLEFIDAYFSNL